MSEIGTEARLLRVAVIGSGPSGFYAADALLKSKTEVHVDVFDRLPCPFGLVRFGVAPDHPKIKSVTRVYEKTAARPGFSFLGNVNVGRDISVEELREFYDAVIFTVGAETDRRLNIPGEDLAGSHTATEFVAWYNGHPDYRDRNFDLSQRVAVVIGQGNVAADVARILGKTVDELKNTDIAAGALQTLAESQVEEIYMIGRRGPAQAAFTEPEIKELGEMADCEIDILDADLDLNPASAAELEDSANSRNLANVNVLRSYATRARRETRRSLRVRFFQSPVELGGDNRVERMVLETNDLTGEAGAQKARGTGNREALACGLVFRSVGYRGVAIPGVPFDEGRGVFRNQAGRVTDTSGDPVPGLYCSGWIKRGPSGVIGTNRPDSVETVGHLLADLPRLQPCPTPATDGVLDLLAKRNVRAVSYADWQTIDAAEVERGAATGKPREKFTSVAEMLAQLA